MIESDVKVYAIDSEDETQWTRLYLMVDPSDEDKDYFMLRNSLVNDRAVYFGLGHLDNLINALSELKEKLTQDADAK